MPDNQLEYVIQADWGDLKKAFGDIANAIRDLGRNVNGLADQFGNMGNRVKNETASAFKAFSNEVKAAHDGLSQVVGSVATLAAGMVGAIAAPTKVFAEFEAQLNKFQAVSSASTAEMEKFKQMSLDLGQASKFSASEIALAGVELTKMGLSATKAQEAMPGLISAAEASGESLDKVSGVMVSVMNGFGIAASESGRIADVLAATANMSATSITEMGNAFTYAAAVGKIANQSFEDVSAALGVVANAGIPAASAGNQLQNMFTRLSAPPKEAADVIKKFGLEVQTADGKLKAMPDILEQLRDKFAGLSDTKITANLKALFGEVALPSAAVLFQATAEQIDTFRNKLYDAAGSAEETAAIMRQGLLYQFEQLKGSLETTAIQIGQSLEPALLSLIGVAQGVVEWFNKLPKPVKDLIANMALLSAAVLTFIAVAGGLALTFTGITVGLTSIVAAVGTAKTALASMQAYMAATALGGTAMSSALMTAWTALLGPIGWVIAAVAAFYLAYKTNFAGIRDITNGFLDFIQPALDWLGKAFSGVGRWIGSAMSNSFKVIFDNAKIVFMGIEKVISGSINTIGNGMAVLGLVVSGQFDAAKEAAKGFVDSLKTIGSGLSDIVLPGFKTIDPNTYTAPTELMAQNKALRGKAFTSMVSAGAFAPAGAVPISGPTGAGGGGGGGGGSTASKERIDALEKEIDTLKKLNEIKKAQIEKDVKSSKAAIDSNAAIEATGNAIAKTAKEFVSSGQALEFAGTKLARHWREQGGNCVYTSDKVLKLSGTLKGLDEVMGRSALSVDDWGVLLKKGYVEVISDLSKVRPGDLVRSAGHGGIVTKGGTSTADIQAFSSIANRQTGLQQGQISGVADSFGHKEVQFLRFTEKAINEKYNAETKLAQMQSANAKEYLGNLLKIEQRLKSQGASQEELKKIGDEVHKAKMDAGAKEADLIKMRQQAEADALKDAQKAYDDQLKVVNDGYDQLIDKAKSYYDSLQQQATDYAEQQATMGLDAVGKQEYESAKALAKTEKEINDIIKKRSDLLEQVEAVKASNKGIKETPEIQEKLNKLLKEQSDIEAYILKLREGYNQQVTNEGQKVADAKFSEKRKQEVVDFETQEEAVNKLLSNREELEQFFEDINTGSKTFDDFAGGLGLTALQIERLYDGMAGFMQADMGAAISDGFKQWDETTWGTTKELSELTDTAKHSASALGNLFGDFGDKAASAVNKALTAFQGMGNAISEGDVLGAILAGVSLVADAIGGALFPNEAKIEAEKQKFIDQIIKADQEVLKLRMERLKRSGDEAGAAQIALTLDSQGIDAQINQAKETLKKNVADLQLKHINPFGVMTNPEAFKKDLARLEGTYNQHIAELEDKRKESANKINADIEAANNEQAVKDSEAFMANLEKANDAYFQAIEDRQKAEDDARHKRQAKEADYHTKQNRGAAVKMLAAEMVDQFQSSLTDSQAEEALGSMMESAAGEWSNIYQEVVDTFEAGAEREAEIEKRKAQFYGELKMKAADAIAKYQAKLDKEAEDKQKQSLADLEKRLKDKMDTLKRLREQQFKEDVKPFEAIIKSEEARLKVIEKQTAAYQKQIEAINKVRGEEQASFDASDIAKFNEKMASVDLAPLLRQGLGDIHNPEGVNTGTYSSETQRKAMEERIDLMKLENENKLGLEEITLEQFQQNEINIAAIRAKFASELLKNDKLTTRERLEIQKEWKDAYVEFQKLSKDAIDERFDSEIEGVEKSIQANEAQKEAIVDNINVQKEAIDGLRVKFESDNQLIVDSLDRVNQAQNGWSVSIAQVRENFSGMVQSVIDEYNSLKASLSQPIIPTIAPQYTAPPQQSTQYAPMQIDIDALQAQVDNDNKIAAMLGLSYVGKYADGGVVPPGYPNDSGWARVTSGERIIPAGATYGDTNINITGTFNNEIDVKRAVLAALKESRPSVNGAYTGSLN